VIDDEKNSGGWKCGFCYKHGQFALVPAAGARFAAIATYCIPIFAARTISA